MKYGANLTQSAHDAGGALALLALVLYPLVWLISLPFRLVGIAVEGVFEFLRAILLLPATIFGYRRG